MRAIIGISKVYQRSKFSGPLFSTVSRYSETEGGMVPDSDSATVRGPLTGKPYDEKNNEMAKDKNKIKNDDGSGLSEYMADKAKEGRAKAADNVIDAGEKAKETAEDMWQTTKDAANKIKDKVANGESKVDEVAQRNYEPLDRHVEDFRKRCGGYDLRSD